MEPAVTTLLFDFGGTLDADGVAWKERVHAGYRAEGLVMSAAEFAPLYYAADDRLMGLLPRTAGLSETVHRLMASLERGLARASHRAEDEARGRRVAAQFLADASASFQRNRGLLASLREKYRLGIVSNFYGNLETVCREAELAPLFAVMIDSRIVGVEKPDPAIFEAALSRFDASPAETVVIGDSLARDGAGAERTGMRFIWVAPIEQQASMRRIAGASPPHPAIARLSELADILL